MAVTPARRSARVRSLSPLPRGAPAAEALARSAFTYLPNAALPIVTIAGLMFGGLIAGAVVVESVFSWPGVGRLTVSAVGNRDLAVVQAALLLITVSMVATNLVVDAIYCLFDPRLRASSAAHH